MPEPKPKRRSAIDTLVVRDRTAVFWFLAACGAAAASAWYVTLMADVLKQRPPFVVMDTAGSYYVPPGIPYAEMDAMHLHLSEVMAETLLERTPEGLVHADRLAKLCTDEAFQQIRRDLEKEGRYFSSQKGVQHAVMDRPTILVRTASQVKTEVRGKVHRRSFFGGKEQAETYSFVLVMIWKQNTTIVANKAFPSRLREHALTLTKISDS